MTASGESDDEHDNYVGNRHANGNDASDNIDNYGIIDPRRLQRILSSSSFTIFMSLFCTILLLLCVIKEAITELNSFAPTPGDFAPGGTARRSIPSPSFTMASSAVGKETPANNVRTNEALNTTTATDRDSFLVLSTTASDAALNWHDLNHGDGHASGWRHLFDALHDLADIATATSQERQMLLATLDGVLDT